MSKAATKVNVTINNTKQNVSKILLSQLMSDANGIANCKYDCVDRRIATLKHCIGYSLINSGYSRSHSATGWSSEDFEFHFEYGRRGGCRVSYMNNQGLQSAVFQASEWRCMMDYLKRRIGRLIDRLHNEKEEEARKAEEERFQRAVETAVLNDIAKGSDSRIRNMLEIEQVIHGNPSDGHCKCSYTRAAENEMLKERTGHDAAYYARKINEKLKERIDSAQSISLDNSTSEGDFVEG